MKKTILIVILMTPTLIFAGTPEEDPVVAKVEQLYLEGKPISGSFFSKKEQIWSCDVLAAKPGNYLTAIDLNKRVFTKAKDGLVLSYNKDMENSNVLWVSTKNGLESNIQRIENSIVHVLHRNIRYAENDQLLVIETSQNSKYFTSAMNEGRCPRCKDHAMSKLFPNNFLLSFQICKRIE